MWGFFFLYRKCLKIVKVCLGGGQLLLESSLFFSTCHSGSVCFASECRKHENRDIVFSLGSVRQLCHSSWRIHRSKTISLCGE